MARLRQFGLQLASGLASLGLMTIAVYAGSFDPITKGHLDLIARAGRVFDQLVVGIGVNANKKCMFSLEERTELIRATTRHAGARIEIRPFDGLLVDFCRDVQASVIIRGLRAVTDFEAELGVAHANSNMVPEIDTFFLPTNPEYSFVSSSIVREIACHNSDTGWKKLSNYVSPVVVDALKRKVQS
jgi:pantetheine-phosphate adenylyltransferase